MSHSTLRFPTRWYAYSDAYPLTFETKKDKQEELPDLSIVESLPESVQEQDNVEVVTAGASETTLTETSLESSTESVAVQTEESQKPVDPTITIEYWTDRADDEFLSSGKLEELVDPYVLMQDPTKKSKGEKRLAFRHQIRLQPGQLRQSAHVENAWTFNHTTYHQSNKYIKKTLTITLSYGTYYQVEVGRKRLPLHTKDHVLSVLQPTVPKVLNTSA